MRHASGSLTLNHVSNLKNKEVVLECQVIGL